MSQPSVQLKFLIKYKQINLCWCCCCCCCVAVAGKIFFFIFILPAALSLMFTLHRLRTGQNESTYMIRNCAILYTIHTSSFSCSLSVSPISPKFCIRNLNAVIEIILNISLRAHTLHFISFSLGVESCEIRIIPCAAAFLRIFYPSSPLSMLPLLLSLSLLYSSSLSLGEACARLANEPKIYVRLILV